MSKKENKKQRYKGKLTRESAVLPFGTWNYILFGSGLLLLVTGYFALSRKPWDSVWSLTVAPVLLVLAYLVVFPVAILYHRKNRKEENID